jgi:glyoxylase-like metal-dependent hydrolase (beta-lactamase superfamily II)
MTNKQQSGSGLNSTATPLVVPFFDAASNTFSYLVKDPAGEQCAVIDSVLEFDYPSGTISYQGADQIIAYIKQHKLALSWLLETHVHADHLSAAPYIQGKVGGKLGIGQYITTIQQTFGKIFNEGSDFARDGSQFDSLFAEGDSIDIGSIHGQAFHTPGHTPACMSYLIGDALFVGDTLFMPDGGTARADFPGGDARQLYHSIQRLLSLPDQLRVFVCHDYQPNDREVAYQTTVATQRKLNIHVNETIDEQRFVSMREQRDKTLGMPKLILPSLQVNMRGGHLPTADSNGQRFLKIPINAFC